MGFTKDIMDQFMLRDAHTAQTSLRGAAAGHRAPRPGRIAKAASCPAWPDIPYLGQALGGGAGVNPSASLIVR